MEVPARGFSIREFALKARTVDVGKCWPFKGDEKDLKTEEIRSRLPPIVYRKYRWWSDELAVVKFTEKAKNLEAKNTEARVLEEKAGTEVSVEVSSVGNVDSGVEKVVSGVDEEGMFKICPVCGTFTASTINAVNAHIDSCLAQASREERHQMRTAAAEAAAAWKSKSRTPKKRSIVEIFAVAPQIETLDEEEEERTEAREGDDRNVSETFPMVVSKRKKREQKRLKMDKKVKILKKKTKKKKKKMPKKTHRDGLLALLAVEKEEVQKSKTPSALDRQLLASSSRPGKMIKDPHCSQKKKASSQKGLSKKYQQKIIQSSKLISKLQLEPPAFPLQSILKKQSRDSSGKKPSSTGNLQGFNIGKHQYFQQSNKHVRFSDKDDILGQPTKWNSSTVTPQTRCLSKVVSDVTTGPVNDLSVETDRPLPSLAEAQEMNSSGPDISPSLVDGREVRSLQLSDDHVTLPTVASSNGCKRHDTGKNSLGELVDLNRAVSPSNFPCPLVPEMLNSIPEEGLNTDGGSHLECSVPAAPQASRTLPDHSLNCVAKSAAASSSENMTHSAICQSPLSLVATSMECNVKQPLLAQGSWQNPISNYLQYQPSGQFSRKDFISSLCSSMELKKQLALKNGQLVESRRISDPGSVCKDMSVDEDFVSLPLNSQGEFIQLNSNANLGSNELLKKKNTPLVSIGNFPVYNPAGPNNTVDHSNLKSKFHGATSLSNLRWFPEHNYLDKNCSYIPVSSRFGRTSLQDARRTEAEYCESVRDKNQSTYQLDSEVNLMSSSCRCKEYNQPHRHTEKGLQALGILDHMSLPTSQTTMRLMGKNVTVGRCSEKVNGSEDGNIWTDKEIIAEHRPVNASDNSIHRQFQQEWVVRPISDPTHSVQTQCNLNTPSLLQMTNLNCHTHLTSRNRVPLISEDYGTRLCHTRHPTSSQQLLDKTSMLPETCISGISHGQDAYPQHILFGSTHFKHNSCSSYTARSDPQLLVSDQECRGNIQPLRTQQSSSSLPQWLKNATQEKQIQQHFTPFQSSDSIPKHRPSPNFGSKLSFLPCPYITSDISFPADSSSTSHPSLHSSSSASIVNPSLIPAFPRLTPTSANNSNLRSVAKNIGREKPKTTYFKDPDHAKKSKKRPASKAEESTKLTKKPNIEMQDSNALSGSKRRDCLHGYTHYYTGSPELHAQRDKFVDLGFSGLRTDKDTDRTTASVVNPFKFDREQRSGPVKLSAGAKHILKPSRNTDEDNSRPIHSILPFAMAPNSGKTVDFQKKSAKIYRF